MHKASLSHRCKALSIVFMLTLTVNMLFSACTAKDIILSFESIDYQENCLGYTDPAPNLILIANSDEAKQLEDWISNAALAQLYDIDYTQSFALAVLSGWRAQEQPNLQVERISRKGKQVTVFVIVEIWENDHPLADAESSLYHLVQVQKSGQWDTDIDFELVFNGTTVATQSHYIP